MASKSLKTPGYAFPAIPTKYDSTDKRFIGEIKKLFDTLFSFKQKATKEYAPAAQWELLYPVGIVVWTDTNNPPRWKTGGGTWTGMGTVTTDSNKTLYAFKRTA